MEPLVARNLSQRGRRLPPVVSFIKDLQTDSKLETRPDCRAMSVPLLWLISQRSFSRHNAMTLSATSLSLTVTFGMRHAVKMLPNVTPSVDCSRSEAGFADRRAHVPGGHHVQVVLPVGFEPTL